MFYTDTGYDTIVVMKTDGSSVKVVINQGLDQPRAICLDAQNGYGCRITVYVLTQLHVNRGRQW